MWQPRQSYCCGRERQQHQLGGNDVHMLTNIRIFLPILSLALLIAYIDFVPVGIVDAADHCWMGRENWAPRNGMVDAHGNRDRYMHTKSLLLRKIYPQT